MSTTGRILARAVSGVLLAKVLGSALSLASQIMLARLLGVDSYGVYVYLVAAISLLVLPVTMGLDKGALRFVSAYKARDEVSLLRGYIGHAHKRVLAVGLGVGAAIAAGGFGLAADIGKEFSITLAIACLLLPSMGLAELSASCLQGLQRVVMARFVTEFVRPFLLSCGVGSIYLAGLHLSAAEGMAIHVSAYVGVSLALGGILMFIVRRDFSGIQKTFAKQEWRRTSWQMALIGGLHIVVSQTDILMLGIINGTTSAGIYGVASKVAMLALFGLTAGNAIVAPMIAELFAKRDMLKLQAMISLAAKGTSALTLVLSVGIVLFKSEVLGAFGGEFLGAETALLILLAGQTVNALMGPVGFIMTMTEHQSVAAKVIGLSALLNIVLNLLFIPLWGIEGAALATAISTASWNIALSILAHKLLGLRSSVF